MDDFLKNIFKLAGFKLFFASLGNDKITVIPTLIYFYLSFACTTFMSNFSIKLYNNYEVCK